LLQNYSQNLAGGGQLKNFFVKCPNHSFEQHKNKENSITDELILHSKRKAELRALSSSSTSQPSTPQKGDSSLTRSQSSSAKVKRRSRSKSPFRSFRWKRSSTANADQSDEEEEGIILCFSYL